MLGLHWEPISSETGRYDKKGGGEDPGSCRVRHYRIKNIVRAAAPGILFPIASILNSPPRSIPVTIRGATWD